MNKSAKKNKLNTLKKVLSRKNIMSMVTSITLLILIIAVSVAWFTMNRTAVIDELGSKVSDWDFIVSTTSMGPQIENDTEINVLANSIKTSEVADGKLAPGVSGNFKLYVRTSSDVASAYMLRIDKNSLVIDVEGVEDAESTTEELTGYLQKHICFYKDSEFKEELTSDNPIEGDLTLGEEATVTVYWKWQYDGNFLCNDTMSESDKERVISEYDNEDVLISRYSNYIQGNIRIVVSGIQKEPGGE